MHGELDVTEGRLEQLELEELRLLELEAAPSRMDVDAKDETEEDRTEAPSPATGNKCLCTFGGVISTRVGACDCACGPHGCEGGGIESCMSCDER